MMGPEAADNLKYTLRSLLELALKKCTSLVTRPPVPTINGDTYETCRHAMFAADSYEAARLAFGCFWAGHANYEFVSGRHVMSSTLCPRHEMLDRLVPLHDRAVDLSDNPVPWVRQTIIGDSSVDESTKRATYRFRESVARRLSSALPKPRELLPDEWTSLGIRAPVLRQVLQALVHRCMYHAIAIDVIAGHYQVDGGCIDGLLLRLDWGQLVSQVSAIARVSRADVAMVLGKLRFGASTTTPDPALQPIIAVGPSEIVVPCWTMTSSSVERNFLTLQARIDRSSFDSQSWLFERRMSRDLEAVMQELGIVFRSRIPTQAGETDLLFASPDGASVFVVEMKWFIPPGDLRETLERTPTVVAGAAQAKRKLAALRQAGGAQLALKLSTSPSAYTALVVTDGFSTATGDDDVACVPASVFRRLLSMMRGGADLITLLRAQPWLPVEGTHFQRVSMEHALDGIAFEWSCHTLLPAAGDLASQWIDQGSVPR